MTTRRKRHIVIFLVVLLAVLAARECGVLDFSLHWSRFSNEYASQLQQAEAVRQSDLTIEMVDGDEVRQHRVARGAGAPMNLRAELKPLQYSGWTWTPLYKSARTDFEITVTSSSPEVHGQITGYVERTTIGLLS